MNDQNGSPDWFSSQIQVMDAAVPRLRAEIHADDGSRNAGGMVSPENGMADPPTVIGKLTTLISAYCYPESAWHHNPGLAADIRRVFDFVFRTLRPDGNLDSLTTNFDSAPDGSFAMYGLVLTYAGCRAIGPATNDQHAILAELHRLIVAMSAGIRTGGFHTPNHRWVISSALAMAWGITGENDNLTVIDRYLAEGIDQDDEGEFTERSPSVYNPVNLRALIYLAEIFDRPQLLEHVRRNLNLMFFYREADGSMCTVNSRRQDAEKQNLDTRYFSQGYFEVLLYMAWRDHNPQYATWVRELFHRRGALGLGYPFVQFRARPELAKALQDLVGQPIWHAVDHLPPSGLRNLVPEPLPEHFIHFQPRAQMLRARQGALSCTALTGSSRFLQIQLGSMRIAVKVCASFFAVAQVRPEHIAQVSDNQFELTYTGRGRYLEPFAEPPASPLWDDMDIKARSLALRMELNFRITVRILDQAVELRVQTDGYDHVPLKIDIICQAGTVVRTKDTVRTAGAGETTVVSAGVLQLNRGSDHLSIGPMFAEHTYAAQMRGSEPPSTSEATWSCTTYTPTDRTLVFRAGH